MSSYCSIESRKTVSVGASASDSRDVVIKRLTARSPFQEVGVLFDQSRTSSLSTRNIRTKFLGVAEVDVDHLGLRLVAVDVQEHSDAARQTVGDRDLRGAQQRDGTHAQRSCGLGGKGRRQIARGREHDRSDLVIAVVEVV